MISNLGKYIPLIFLITFVIIIFDSIISLQGLRTIVNDENRLSQTYHIINETAEVRLVFSQANTEQKKYLLSANMIYLNAYQALWKRLNMLVLDLQSSTKNNAQQQKTLTKFKKTIDEKYALLNSGIALIQNGGTQLPNNILQQEDVVNSQIDTLSSQIIQQQMSLLITNRDQFESSVNYMYATIILSALLTVILLIFSYMAIMRELRQRTLLEHKKNEFISLASHELKTPITTMSIFAEILAKNVTYKTPKQAQQILSKMTTQISEMKNLINDLLDVTRIQLGKLEVEKELIALDEVIQETIDEIQPTTKKHKIVYKKDAPTKVLADRQRIWQVLANILNNAIKYSPNGGNITITLTKKRHFAQVSVQDKGIGISKKNIKSIFGRYFREEGDSQSQFTGLGLGLYLSQEIITIHGGKIWVKSAVGKGSTFFFTLPLPQ